MASAGTPERAELSRLLARISHEIRTPLGALAIWLRLCRESPDGAERARALDRIEDSFASLLGTARDLSTWSALMESGRELERSPTGLTTLIERAVTSLRERSERRSVRLEFPAPEREVHVDADAERLGRALEAILWHAIVCRPPHPALALRLEADSTHASLLVPLTESGWEPLRPREPCSPGLGARGLGLEVALEIIDLHGGRLSLGREADGDQLVLRLPRLEHP